MRWAVLLLAFVGHVPLQGQVDSLLRVLHSMQPGDTSRFLVLDRITRKLLLNAPDSARGYAEELLLSAEEAGVKRWTATAENLMATCLDVAGRRMEALRHFQRAITLYSEVGRPDAVALVYGNIGHLHGQEGDLEKAVEAYRRSIAGYTELGNEVWAAGMIEGLANVYGRMGMLDSAEILFGRSAEVLIRLHSPHHAVIARHAQAQMNLQLKRGAEALRLEREALGLMGDWSNDHMRSKVLGGLADALSMVDSVPQAMWVAHEALAVAMRAGFLQQQADISMVLAGLYERSGHPDSALVHLRRHLALREELASEERQRVIAEMQARFDSERKDVELALQKAIIARRALLMKVLIGGALGLLVALVFLWRALAARQRMAEQLEGTNTRITTALRDKELLLREIHHRVKNNLQMVGSLLRMQGRGINDPVAREAVRDSQDRVRSMALIHQDLYQEEDVRGIDMTGYVDKLARGLLKSHGIDPDRIRVVVEVPPLRLDVDSAIPIGLILNELIVNALKYAFPGGRSGTLHIALHRQVDGLHLEVSDDGVGYSVSAVNEEGGTGFGMGMLRTFAEKLQADHEMSGEGGTTVRMRIRNFKLAG